MKFQSLSRIALLSCAMGVAGLTGVWAQDTNSAPAPDSMGGHHYFDSVLTADEKTELKNDREQVFTANPDLKSEGKDLWDQRKTMKDASAEDKQAFHAKWHAYMDKLNTAIVGVDANAAPIIAKLKAAHHEHHQDAADGSASSSNS